MLKPLPAICLLLVFFLSLSCSSNQPNSGGTLDDASKLISAEQYAGAVPILENLSAHGDAVATYKLAELYYKGLGLKENVSKAALLYESAAQSNVMHAQQNIAVMYLKGDGVKQDLTKAMYWFNKAAQQGDAFAQFSLGLRYFNGEGAQLDYSTAMMWFRKAADQGYAPALYMIGVMYDEGKSVRANTKEAMTWMLGSANKGYALAQYKVGFAYFNGRGFDKNLIEAYKWLVLCQELSGRPIDLSNPNWEPNMGSAAISVAHQFESVLSGKELHQAEKLVRDWLASQK